MRNIDLLINKNIIYSYVVQVERFKPIIGITKSGFRYLFSVV